MRRINYRYWGFLLPAELKVKKIPLIFNFKHGSGWLKLHDSENQQSIYAGLHFESKLYK